MKVSSYPPLSNVVERTVRGSSSVGGWGFDKGTAWHPVSLPPSVPSTSAGKSARAAGMKVNDRCDKRNML